MIEFFKNLFYANPTVDYCEPIRDGLIARPFYAMSNIAFLIVGILILAKGKKTALSKAFGYSMILVGLFSFFYDSTYSYLFQIFDVAGMYIFITLLILLNLKRLKMVKSLWWRWPLVAIALFIFYFFKGEAGNIIFGLFVIFVLASEWFVKEKYSRKYWIIGVSLFLLGFVVWIFDATKIFCLPSGIVNGRGVFHVLESIAVYFMYKHYSQESIPKS